MVNCQRVSLKRKRQPEVAPRRSARLNPPIQPATESHTLAQKDASAPANDACLHSKDCEKPSSRGRKRLKEHHDLPGSKRRRLTCELPSYEGVDPIDHWRRSDFFWPKEDWSKDKMDRYLPRKKSTSALRRKRSDSDSGAPSMDSPTTITPSDQKPREQKSAEYRDPRYKIVLASKGSYMNKNPLGIREGSTNTCQQLLQIDQSVPTNTLFDDDLFEDVCESLQDKNEARVIRDISLLLVPSAENLAIRGEKELRILIDSVNEGWNNSIPFTKTRPQPDYAVGFNREAFSEDQLKKIGPFVGDIYTELSLFLGTYYQYFPFLTCEVKCGAAALDIADRQNAHSMTLAVRGVVELFRLVGREKELDREILAFSISHDHCSVRIFGHYPVIEGKNTTYYRHRIYASDFTALDAKDKWTTYKFTKNVYKIWMPTHFKLLCSAIDAIPADLDFGISQSELRFPEHSGLSQGVADHSISESDVTTLGDHSSQLEPVVPLEKTTPDTSFTQGSGPNKSKKPKRKL